MNNIIDVDYSTIENNVRKIHVIQTDSEVNVDLLFELLSNENKFAENIYINRNYKDKTVSVKIFKTAAIKDIAHIETIVDQIKTFSYVDDVKCIDFYD